MQDLMDLVLNFDLYPESKGKPLWGFKGESKKNMFRKIIWLPFKAPDWNLWRSVWRDWLVVWTRK